MEEKNNKDLKKRIIELSWKNNLSHIGSCISAVDIIDSIYSRMKDEDFFILSSGHAGIALYSVIEKYHKIDAQSIYEHHGIHPDRCGQCHIDCTTGSLGHGLGIGIGMALADRYKRVHILCSDGEFAEGSIYESLNVMRDREIKNICLHINCNGYGAYRRIYSYNIANITQIYKYCNIQLHLTTFELPFLDGQDAHYKTMTEQDYQFALQYYT